MHTDQDAGVRVGDHVALLLPGADVVVGALVIDVERDGVFVPLRRFEVWTEAFGGTSLLVYESSKNYLVVDRPESSTEASLRVMRARMRSASRRMDPDPEASS